MRFDVRSLSSAFDDCLVLGLALADLARRDQQQCVDALQRGLERGGFGVVGFARGDAKIGGFRRRADEGDDVGGRDFALELGDDEAAELAGGSGDSDGHGEGSLRVEQSIPST